MKEKFASIFFVCATLLFSFEVRAEFLALDKYEIPVGDANILYYRVPIYSPQDAPSKSSPGNGQAFIKIDLSFSPETDIAIFKDTNAGDIGYVKEDGKEYVCCTKEVQGFNNCSLGMMISTGISSDKASYWIEKQQTRVEKTLPVEETAVYYLVIANCKEDGNAISQVNGQVEFMNPYGELPGDEYYYMPYYGGMSIVYIVMMVVWLILCIVHWRKLLSLQHIISVVLLLSILEVLTSYFDYLGYNNIGLNWAGAMITGALASVFKRTVSRVVLLGVAQGRGVTKGVWGDHPDPTSSSSGVAGKLKGVGRGVWGWCIGGGIKVLVLGIAYGVMAILLSSFELLRIVSDHDTRDILDGFSVFFIWPVGVLDAIFYWWILISLFQTISQLQVKKQMIKLKMYQRFLYILMALGASSAILILSQVIVIVKHPSVDDRWKYEWIWNGTWGIFYALILLGMMGIWRPNHDNSRYSYSEVPDPSTSELSNNEIVLEPLSLSFGDINKRPKPPSADPSPDPLSPTSPSTEDDSNSNGQFVSLKMD